MGRWVCLLAAEPIWNRGSSLVVDRGFAMCMAVCGDTMYGFFIVDFITKVCFKDISSSIEKDF